jgi:sugar-phosphatase
MVITATHSHPIEGGQYRMSDYQTVAASIGDDGRLSIAPR